MLPLLGKIFEKLLSNRIYDFLDEDKFFSPDQVGFRPGMGVTESIGTLLNHIYNSFNDGKFVLFVSFDLKNAFDTLNHKILFSKLLGRIIGIITKTFTKLF